MKFSAGKYWSMRRLADKEGFFKMVAVDQRPPIMNLIEEKTKSHATYEQVAEVKSALARSLMDNASAILLDPIWSWPVFHHHIDPQKGLIVTLEEHDFDEDEQGRRSSEIAYWSVEKIKAMGGDAVKVLAWYRPDAPEETCLYQQAWVEKIGQTCKKYDIPFLFELLLYPLAGDKDQTKDYREHTEKSAKHVVESVKTFAQPKFGVDVFKLESPVLASQIPPLGEAGSDTVQSWFDELGKACPVPWVMLSAGADQKSFKRVMTHASRAGASGYLAGRAIWQKATRQYPNMRQVEEELRQDGAKYMAELDTIVENYGTPWHKHPNLEGGLTFEGAETLGEFTKFYQPEL